MARWSGGLPPWAPRGSLGRHQLERVTSGGSDFEFDVPLPGGATDGLWLYAVPDDTSDVTRDVVLSLASGKRLYVALLDLGSLDAATVSGDAAAAEASVSWVEVELPAAATERMYQGAGDHAHVFAFGSHWISFVVASTGNTTLGVTSETNDVWLLRVERADIEVAVAAGSASVAPSREALVYSADPSTAFRHGALVVGGGRAYATNDHFLLAVDDGVAVVIADVVGGTLFPVVVDPFQLQLQSASAWTPPAGTRANTTGSARHPSPGHLRGQFLAMFPDAVTLEAQNNLYLVRDDAAFANMTAVGSLSWSDLSLQMPSFLVLANGDVVSALKVLPTAVLAADRLYFDDTPVVPDWGSLYLLVAAEGLAGLYDFHLLALASSNTADGSGANRPHLARWGRWLLACWDVADLDGSTNQASKFRPRLALFHLERA